jgi:perosamine synthetase
MPSDSLPALLGGTPSCPWGPPDWPIQHSAIRDALLSAWQTGVWGKYQGGLVSQLEQRLAQMHTVPHVVTCSSGTCAVELALRALKVGPGHEVVLAGYDYFGNFLSIHAVGAMPVLADVDPDNWNLAPHSFLSAIGPKTRAAIVTHLHGGVVPMREIMDIATAHNIAVIEDAAQMPGAQIQGRPAGTWGDAGILSFGGSKLLTAGRGGALFTKHPNVCQRARLHVTRGGNAIFPLSELQAAVLLPQLDCLPTQNEQRRQSASRLAQRLESMSNLRPFRNKTENAAPGYYKLGLQYDAATTGLSRELFVAAMHAEGVALDEGFRALHVGRSPSRFRAAGTLHESHRAHANAVVLHHPVLLEPEDRIDQVVSAIHKVLQHPWRDRIDSGTAGDPLWGP